MQNQPCEQFLSFYKHLYSGNNKRHYILQYSAKSLAKDSNFDTMHPLNGQGVHFCWGKSYRFFIACKITYQIHI